MERNILLDNKLFDARVCSEGSFDEALDWIRRYAPSGTEDNWRKNPEDDFAPVACSKYPNRTHYMFVC